MTDAWCIGASDEVIKQHADQHNKTCPKPGSKPVIRNCSCHVVYVMVCTGCNEPVFALINPEAKELCEHGLNLQEHGWIP